MFFVRTASERDLEKVRALLVETWHATYDTFYGVEKVNELTGPLAFAAGAQGPARAQGRGIPRRRRWSQHRRHGLCVHVRCVEEDRGAPPALRPAETAGARDRPRHFRRTRNLLPGCRAHAGRGRAAEPSCPRILSGLTAFPKSVKPAIAATTSRGFWHSSSKNRWSDAVVPLRLAAVAFLRGRSRG